MKLTKRLLLLLTRSGISDEAKITLLEILLRMSDKDPVPSLTDLSRIRDRPRSRIQVDLEELVKGGVLKKVVNMGTVRKFDYEFHESGLAVLNGFDNAEEVVFKEYIGETHSGAIISAVRKGKESEKKRKNVRVFTIPEDAFTENEFMLLFSEIYRSIFRRTYLKDPRDRVRIKALFSEHGSKRLVEIIRDYLENKHLYSRDGVVSIEHLSKCDAKVEARIEKNR